ncbi:hypothetical protein [Leekyejoonella antrihumi]|uniref:Uncharacterized protein n=1 Tax=Leekyejoonella antrihumi TaxID=1660198 RepID=A0A563DUF0_9MICO|nr:hypothetical protein [Leekyejoonella antrihumi]TWP33875.1 hypothetical protein FGL98_19365 [Leekyejoonella antrihumi]
MWIRVVVLLVVVAVIYLAMRRRRAPEVPAERIEEFDLRLSHDARVAIGTAIARHRKILAVKLYRADTGADLATSKAAIDKWYKGIHG